MSSITHWDFFLSETKALCQVKCNTSVLAESLGQVFFGAHNANSMNGAKGTVTGLHAALQDSKLLTRYTPLPSMRNGLLPPAFERQLQLQLLRKK